jgi:type IV pilus assembly protein PilO
MNPKVEKLLKLPLYQRLIALAALAFLVMGVFVWFVWLPEYDKLEGMEQEIFRLEADYIQKKQIADNLPKFKEEFAKLEQLLQEALTQLPNKKEIPTLLTNLSTLAKDSGLEVATFTPRGEVNKGFYAEVPASLDLVGTYHQIAKFAEAVGKLSRIVNLSNLNLTAPSVASNIATLRIKCKVTTFRFVEQ